MLQSPRLSSSTTSLTLSLQRVVKRSKKRRELRIFKLCSHGRLLLARMLTLKRTSLRGHPNYAGQGLLQSPKGSSFLCAEVLIASKASKSSCSLRHKIQAHDSMLKLSPRVCASVDETAAWSRISDPFLACLPWAAFHEVPRGFRSWLDSSRVERLMVEFWNSIGILRAFRE